MEKGCFRMGVNHSLNKYRNSRRISNKHVKTTFHVTLASSVEVKGSWNADMAVYLLGTKNNFCVFNLEHQVDMLKKASVFLHEIAKKNAKILIVNDSKHRKFDGMVKNLVFRSGQHCTFGKWSCGRFTKDIKNAFQCVIVLNPEQSYFTVKEVNKLGIPLISLNNVDSSIKRTLYPILSNNSKGDSLFFSSYILTNAILEGKLIGFLKNQLND